ncbi:hypothetical protein [Glaciimonas soli]|uniref:Uncharacterized protein n=1 Tax=Glaciimonas soli TaxID=2590999 RepID=A0A843YVU9_9BURK|nr:hypothetical protein [Glaciimonas soli]MQR02107.1 hypothetical protein [Glaciimonas soli]
MKFRYLLIIALFAGVSVFVSTNVAASSTGAAQMMREIKVKGAASVVARLHKNETKHGWDWVLAQASSGNKAWLKVISALHAGTDAGDSEALEITLAEALPKNGAEVLKLLGKNFPVEKVCSAPFIEPEPTFMATYIKTARMALNNETSTALIPIRDSCLVQLNAIKK